MYSRWHSCSTTTICNHKCGLQIVVVEQLHHLLYTSRSSNHCCTRVLKYDSSYSNWQPYSQLFPPPDGLVKWPKNRPQWPLSESHSFYGFLSQPPRFSAELRVLMVMELLPFPPSLSLSSHFYPISASIERAFPLKRDIAAVKSPRQENKSSLPPSNDGETIKGTRSLPGNY